MFCIRLSVVMFINVATCGFELECFEGAYDRMFTLYNMVYVRWMHIVLTWKGECCVHTCVVSFVWLCIWNVAE